MLLTEQLQKFTKFRAGIQSTVSHKVGPEGALEQGTATNVARTTAYHGLLTAHTSLKHSVETTRVFTSGKATLTLIMMVGTPPIKAMERSTNSLTTAHNGKTRIRMGTATTPLQHSTLIPVHSCLEIQPWTDWVAQMSMVMATPMKTIGPRATKSNGSMQTVMGLVTITCTTSHRINSTSTNAVMHSQPIRRSGMTPMAMDMETTTRMFRGTNTEHLNGPA